MIPFVASLAGRIAVVTDDDDDDGVYCRVTAIVDPVAESDHVLYRENTHPPTRFALLVEIDGMSSRGGRYVALDADQIFIR